MKKKATQKSSYYKNFTLRCIPYTTTGCDIQLKDTARYVLIRIATFAERRRLLE